MASRSIGRADPRTRARLVGRILALVLLTLVAVPIHLLWRLVRLPSPWPRLFLSAVGRVCGARVSTDGTRLHASVFYVANHISWLDIPVLAGLTGSAFVAQAPMADWPLIGWLAKLNHTVFVSRTDRLSVDTQITQLRAALDERQPVVIFPEGTTTDGRSLLPFKRALFETVVPPPRPMQVQPVFIDYDDAGKSLAWIGEEDFADNALRVLAREGGIGVVVRFLEPFDPATLGDRKAVADEARNRIGAALSASLGGTAIV